MALESWKQNALNRATEAAQQVARDHPEYPSALLPVSVAQFLLESDWGQRSMGDANNYFGIKARPGEPFVSRPTREYIGGRWVTDTAKFRKFDSMAECFEAHADLICNRRNASGTLIYAHALSYPDDALSFAHALTGVYATDPGYGQKLEAIIRDRGLLSLSVDEPPAA